MGDESRTLELQETKKPSATRSLSAVLRKKARLQDPGEGGSAAGREIQDVLEAVRAENEMMETAASLSSLGGGGIQKTEGRIVVKSSPPRISRTNIGVRGVEAREVSSSLQQGDLPPPNQPTHPIQPKCAPSELENPLPPAAAAAVALKQGSGGAVGQHEPTTLQQCDLPTPSIQPNCAPSELEKPPAVQGSEGAGGQDEARKEKEKEEKGGEEEEEEQARHSLTEHTLRVITERVRSMTSKYARA